MSTNAINIKELSKLNSGWLSHAVAALLGFLARMQKEQTRLRNPIHDFIQVQHTLSLLTFKFNA